MKRGRPPMGPLHVDRLTGPEGLKPSREYAAWRAGVRGYVPALDGIRGMAIIMVVVAHFTIYGRMRPDVGFDEHYFAVATHGVLGVDLFFVLSGFLITGILLDARGEPRFFTNFYMRRVLRIFPLYYGFLCLIFVIGPHILKPGDDAQAFLRQQGWYWSYLSNIQIALHGWPAYHAIGHLWSLAVEEQFYLVWPLLVFLFRRRTFPVVCVLCVVGGLATRIGLWLGGMPPTASVLTPARMDTLALGALLAVMARSGSGLSRVVPWAWSTMAITAVALTGLFARRGGWNPNDPLFHTAGRSLVAFFFGAVLVIAVTSSPASLLGRIFANRFLAFFGIHSYGMYIYHHPIIVYMERHGISVTLFPRFLGSQMPGQIAVFAIAGAATILVSFFSYRFFEEPLLRLKRFFRTSRSGDRGDGQRSPGESTAVRSRSGLMG